MSEEHGYLRELDVRFKKSEYKNILKEQIRNPKQVYEAVKSLEDVTQEKVLAIFVSDDLDEPVFQHVAVGGVDAAFLNPIYLMRQAYLTLASGFILVHNHPSGNPTPSQADRDLIEYLDVLSRLHRMQFIDFMIVGRNDFWSRYEEKGIIYQIEGDSKMGHPPDAEEMDLFMQSDAWKRIFSTGK